MKDYLQRKYGLTDEGTDNLQKAIVAQSIYNLTLIFPMMIAFMFLTQYGGEFFNIPAKQEFSLLHYLIMIVIFFILMCIVGIHAYKKTYTKTYVETAKTRINLAERLRKLPLSYFARKDVADLSSSIMTDATMVEQMFSHAIPQLYAGFVSTTIFAVMLFTFNWKLALSLFWVVPLGFIVFKISRKKQQDSHKVGFAKNRDIFDEMQESFDLVKEIISYNLEDEYIKRMDEKLDDKHLHMKKIELVLGSFVNLSMSMLKVGIGSVAIFGAILLQTGQVDILTYMIFLIISASVYSPIMETFVYMAEILYMDSITERIREINHMPMQEGVNEFNPNGYDIEFKNVSFSYDDEQNVLNDISFKANQGEITALVGPSGCGKTTATKCAARFWDIDSGVITIGGVDISNIEPEKLLQSFSIVFQDVVLFNSSVMENIRLGRSDATDEEVIEVAKLARCDEFINELSDGYNTLIGENGTKLSGGERQRLSIARALLKDAPIILLDEATASLDAENETLIQAAISELIKDKTVIIIAHRMRTVINADKIVALNNGEIVEMGTSKELLDNNGMFSKMYKAQLSS